MGKVYLAAGRRRAARRPASDARAGARRGRPGADPRGLARADPAPPGRAEEPARATRRSSPASATPTATRSSTRRGCCRSGSGRRLAPEEVDALYAATRSTLADAIAVLRERVPPTFEKQVRDFLAVHDKGGQPCPRCGTRITEVSRRLRDLVLPGLPALTPRAIAGPDRVRPTGSSGPGRCGASRSDIVERCDRLDRGPELRGDPAERVARLDRVGRRGAGRGRGPTGAPTARADADVAAGPALGPASARRGRRHGRDRDGARDALAGGVATPRPPSPPPDRPGGPDDRREGDDHQRDEDAPDRAALDPAAAGMVDGDRRPWSRTTRGRPAAAPGSVGAPVEGDRPGTRRAALVGRALDVAARSGTAPLLLARGRRRRRRPRSDARGRRRAPPAAVGRDEVRADRRSDGRRRRRRRRRTRRRRAAALRRRPRSCGRG